MYENSFNSTNEAIAKRKEIQDKKDEADRVRKEKAFLKKQRNTHIDNVVYTIYHNKEVGKVDKLMSKYEVSYVELIDGFKRVYNIKSWSDYTKHMNSKNNAEKLFDFRTKTVPIGKVVARSSKFKHKSAILTRNGETFLVNEKNMSITKYKYYPNPSGTMMVRMFSNDRVSVANLMWMTFRDKSLPKHTILGYKDNDKTNLDITNLYIKRNGVKGDK